SKEATDRYQQPIEVAEALAEWAEQPITPPPAKEMPIHCPQVQALAGPSMTGPASGSPLARALFGPGRGGFARSGSSSSVHSVTGQGGTTAPRSTASYHPAARRNGGNGSRANQPLPDANVGVGGPISTARASASPTAPLPTRPGTEGPL